MKKASKAQIGYFNFLTRSQGVIDERETLVAGYTDQRETESEMMSPKEMGELIAHLKDEGQSDKMTRKIFSLAHQLGWTVGSIPDHERITQWMLKYSYLHKKLNSYTLQELPKLVTQFEKMASSQLSGTGT